MPRSPAVSRGNRRFRFTRFRFTMLLPSTREGVTTIDRVGPESLLHTESLLGCVSDNRGRPVGYEQSPPGASRELVCDALTTNSSRVPRIRHKCINSNSTRLKAYWSSVSTGCYPRRRRTQPAQRPLLRGRRCRAARRRARRHRRPLGGRRRGGGPSHARSHPVASVQPERCRYQSLHEDSFSSLIARRSRSVSGGICCLCQIV